MTWASVNAGTEVVKKQHKIVVARKTIVENNIGTFSCVKRIYGMRIVTSPKL